MEMIMSHQTAICPKYKKDSFQLEYKSIFSRVTCIWCGTKFKNGKIIKEKEE